MNKKWCVYILRCDDGTLYCGSTNNLEERVKAHNNKKGAKYTRGRTPVKVVYSKKCIDRSNALVEECALKKLSRKEKEALLP